MEIANLSGLVDGVCVSREIGVAKPDPGIFPELTVERIGEARDSLADLGPVDSDT